jgi:FSR family fosmidomycin resistance protein-like MFS transporter
VLASSGARSTESGVFVGPGALGLATGIWLGGHGVPARWVLIGLLLASAPLLLQIGKRAVRTTRSLPRAESTLLVVVVVCAACLVGSVTVRALVGGTIAGAWRGVSVEVMWALAIAAMMGKMAGGFIGDRLGWATTSVLALVISAPLISFFVGTPWGAVLGMLIFQMTMPVTLKAMHHVMPERPGLAFGIPCMALLAGALPGVLGVVLFPEWTYVLGTALITALVVGVGLALLVRSGASAGPARDWLTQRLARPQPTAE